MKEIPSKAGKKFNLIMDITLVFERYIYLHSGFYEVQVVHNQWANLKLSKSSMYFRPKMHDFGFYMTNVNSCKAQSEQSPNRITFHLETK